jgi:ABC-2 type transport system permease protein
MRKFWLVVKHEYQNRVRKRSFVVGTLLIPLFLGVIIAVTILIIEREANNTPLGYVDHSGILAKGLVPRGEVDEEVIEMIGFSNKETAIEALENGDIQAFQVLPSDYLETQKVELYYWDEYPDQSVLDDFDDFIRANLLPEGTNTIQTRIIDGINLTLQSADGTRTFDESGGFVTILFPIAVAMFIIFAAMGASGYFLQVITDEKENRTMEITITSISPWQLIGGKSIALIAVALTQITIWFSTVYLAIIFIARIFPEIQSIEFPWELLLVFITFFIPTFALMGGIMTAIGGVVTELQEGQQIAGILNLLFTFPLFLTALVIANPNNPFLVFFSFWPTTSLVMITLRWGLTVIPIWQIILSWLILVITGCVTIWAASRIFRFGMLRYGKRLSLKAVVEAVRSVGTP